MKVHFTQAQSITGATGVSGTSSIDSQDDTKAMFDVTGLTKVGDYAEAVYTVRNDSNGIGAEITLNLNSSNTEYFKVTETILDDKLQAGEETTAKIRVEMIKTPITDAVSTTITATITASPLEDAQASGGSSASKVAGEPESFATDSWATIQKAVQNNNTSAYNVGDTKEVTINGNNYTVRIANKSINESCNNENYSQTACGFVVEFADIITKKTMNGEVEPYNGSCGSSDSIGGYAAMDLYDYLNNELYSILPDDLKNVIILTKVGYNDENGTIKYTAGDKLYLLSSFEIFENSNYVPEYQFTRRLDYYLLSGMEEVKAPWGETLEVPKGTSKKVIFQIIGG